MVKIIDILDTIRISSKQRLNKRLINLILLNDIDRGG